ncbi:alpha-methylacyl-CoA racemase [Litorivivens lipolytica]|uniref:Alpha-methylacyl-CoA racemase n=1 Tax=Litorivivens lipolytica TaxID=1524264 RepID=A0A7W4Z572_9GAMM|nr:CaiB/BaiF CoA-transferase family protein [Litorivivens lipolytica]MBB3047194.1 alpha-methylacyl-CoA racemase [Litorivivens lipolytica]
MGPLTGMRIIEIEGLGPAPFCGMMFADMGAEVISISRKSGSTARPAEISERGKRSIALNLKSPQGVEALLKLCETADALIEGFRPGVAERLGIGPDDCWARNPKLVYGRMTGWGQTGPLAHVAGHDMNYISLSGALHAIGRAGEKPVPPLNLVGDFGGGGMFLAFGVMSAIWEAGRSGKGQVVDVSMVEGSAALMHMMYSFKAMGVWENEREQNMLDGAAHFYDTYETSDGKYVSIGSIEPQFYALLIELAGLDKDEFAPQMDKAQWPKLKEKLAAVIKTKTRDEWCEIMEGTDVCFAPVLSMTEAPTHPHNVARQSFVEIDGVMQHAPAPRFSRTAPATPTSAKAAGSETEAVLKEAGYSEAELAALREAGALT